MIFQMLGVSTAVCNRMRTSKIFYYTEWISGHLRLTITSGGKNYTAHRAHITSEQVSLSFLMAFRIAERGRILWRIYDL